MSIYSDIIGPGLLILGVVGEVCLIHFDAKSRRAAKGGAFPRIWPFVLFSFSLITLMTAFFYHENGGFSGIALCEAEELAVLLLIIVGGGVVARRLTVKLGEE